MSPLMLIRNILDDDYCPVSSPLPACDANQETIRGISGWMTSSVDQVTVNWINIKGRGVNSSFSTSPKDEIDFHARVSGCCRCSLQSSAFSVSNLGAMWGNRVDWSNYVRCWYKLCGIKRLLLPMPTWSRLHQHSRQSSQLYYLCNRKRPHRIPSPSWRSNTGDQLWA